MSQSKTAQAFIVLITGLPGSGKSYLATKLAEKLNAEYLNSDRVRQNLDAQGDYSFRDKLTIYKVMVKTANEMLNKGKPVIVDATFYKASLRRLFYQMAQENLAPVYTILVEAEEDLVKERLNGKRDHSEADFDVYRLIKEEFEEITHPHLKILSTNSNIDQMIEKAIQYLKEVHEG